MSLTTSALFRTAKETYACKSTCVSRRPYGPMDKAPAYGAGDSRFDPWYGQDSLLLSRTMSDFITYRKAFGLNNFMAIFPAI